MNVFRAFVLSLIIHLGLMALLRFSPDSWWQPDLPGISVTEIQFIEKPAGPKSERQIVRDVEVPESNQDKSSKDKARFISEKDQRVLVETQARESGLTRNSRIAPLPKDSWLRKYQERLDQEARARAKTEKGDGYEPIPLPSPKDASRWGFEGAPATTGELLPDDVALGEFTALNTDRFKYYSFYARVEELVRFRWNEGLRRAVESIPQNQLRNLHRDRWVTKVEFWLTKDGRYHSAHVHNESGIKRFDRAAIHAFEDARVFPNPPPELIGDDGLIRLQYSFTVRWSPQAFVNR